MGGGTVVRDEGKLEGVDRGIPLCWRDKGGNGVCLVNGSGRRQGRQCERDGECSIWSITERQVSVLWTSCHTEKLWLESHLKKGSREVCLVVYICTCTYGQ